MYLFLFLPPAISAYLIHICIYIYIYISIYTYTYIYIYYMSARHTARTSVCSRRRRVHSKQVGEWVCVMCCVRGALETESVLGVLFMCVCGCMCTCVPACVCMLGSELVSVQCVSKTKTTCVQNKFGSRLLRLRLLWSAHTTPAPVFFTYIFRIYRYNIYIHYISFSIRISYYTTDN